MKRHELAWLAVGVVLIVIAAIAYSAIAPQAGTP